MVPAHSVIPRVLAQIIRPAPLCQEKIEFAWRAAVGPAVARVSQVRLTGQGVLIVTLPNEHWCREIERSRGLIRARLEAFLGPDVIDRVECVRHD